MAATAGKSGNSNAKGGNSSRARSSSRPASRKESTKGMVSATSSSSSSSSKSKSNSKKAPSSSSASANSVASRSRSTSKKKPVSTSKGSKSKSSSSSSSSSASKAKRSRSGSRVRAKSVGRASKKLHNKAQYIGTYEVDTGSALDIAENLIDPEGNVKESWVRTIALVSVFVLVFACVFLVPRDEMKAHIDGVIEWMKTLSGPLPVAVFVVVHAIAVTFCFPGTIMFEFGAGALFGWVGGVAVVSLSKAIGASCAFLLGRTLAREWVQRRLKSRPAFRKSLNTVKKSQFKVALLLRLSPIPSWVNNYGLAITPISFAVFMFATVFGGLFFIINNVYIGYGIQASLDVAVQGGAHGGVSYMKIIGYASGLIVTGVLGREITKATSNLDPEDV